MRSLAAHYSLFRSLSRVWIYALAQLPLLRAAPLSLKSFTIQEDAGEGRPPDDPLLWIYFSVAVALVLLGGVFAGLTIALMGQASLSDHFIVVLTFG